MLFTTMDHQNGKFTLVLRYINKGLEKEETVYTRFPGTNSLLGSPPKDMKAIVNIPCRKLNTLWLLY